MEDVGLIFPARSANAQVAQTLPDLGEIILSSARVGRCWPERADCYEKHVGAEASPGPAFREAAACLIPSR
eukprot:3168066-Alexandrium_andersonii.AAC.1